MCKEMMPAEAICYSPPPLPVRVVCAQTAFLSMECFLSLRDPQGSNYFAFTHLVTVAIALAALVFALFIACQSCENILCGYLYEGDLAFVFLKEIYGFKFPKRFLEISSRDLTSFLLLFLFCQS
jgi:hypothetical protein